MVIDASGGLAATTRNPPMADWWISVLDNLTAYDDTEFDSPADTGSIVNVFNNNFSTPENYYIACDPETMTCQQLAGANISVDPLFQDDDGDASQMEESSDGLTGKPACPVLTTLMRQTSQRWTSLGIPLGVLVHFGRGWLS